MRPWISTGQQIERVTNVLMNPDRRVVYTIRGSKSSTVIFLTAQTANALAKNNQSANLKDCIGGLELGAEGS
jgi:hypothetical protein